MDSNEALRRQLRTCEYSFAGWSHFRARLAGRLVDLPSDGFFRQHLSSLAPEALRVLVASDAWPVVHAGGEEVDVDLLFPAQDAPQPLWRDASVSLVSGWNNTSSMGSERTDLATRAGPPFNTAVTAALDP